MTTLIERREARERSRTPRRSLSSDRHSAIGGRTELAQDYDTRVRRSFTPLRELVHSASARYLPSYEYPAEYGYNRPATAVSKSDGWMRNTNPFVITTHAIEDHPIGKYDVFIPGGWSYPIYKYLHHKSYRPDNSYMVGGRYQPRRDYAFYNAYRPSYLAGEMSYYHGDINRALHNYRKWASPTYSSASTPWYRSYFGDPALRHFGGFRPRQVNHFLKAVWVR